MQRIHIFRAGRQTSSSGVTIDFTAADIAAMAAAYDPSLSEAPIVVGHPQTDGPAYGWVQALQAVGEDLFAVPHQVNPEFSAMVEAGAFKKVSVALYAKDSPANPVPGVYYVRHVGYLGAAPPAVKGLKPTEFKAQATDCLELELNFAEHPMKSATPVEPTAAELAFAGTELAGLLNAAIDKLVNDKTSRTDVVSRLAAAAGIEASTVNQILNGSIKVPPEERLKGFARVLGVSLKALMDSLPKQFSEGEEMSDADRARLAALETENAALKAAQTAQAQAARRAEHTAFAESLEAECRITGADKPLIVAALGFMEPVASATPDAQAPAVVEFGEGDAKKPLADALKAWFKTLPKRVEFGEQASRGRAAADADVDADVQYAEGTTPEQKTLDQKIRALAKKHGITYAAAAQAVATQG